MFEQYSDLVSVKELMKMLNIGKDRAYHLINSKQIKSFKIGRRIKIPKKYIVEFLDAQCN